MKRIINGKTYNTDTATRVAGGENGHSDAWWGLYQTRHGAFFEIVVGHHSELEKFSPLTDLEAQKLLEKQANHLVEQYFGPMPEGGASERRLTVRIPGNLADRIETVATEMGRSFNSFAMRCFEQYVDAADAAKGIETVLSALDRAKREPDRWESTCLAQAINSYFRGMYRQAQIEAADTLTPLDQRGDIVLEELKHSISELRAAFISVQTGNVRQFPHFGPIIFTGGAR